MKKLLAFILNALLVVSLIGCNSENVSQKPQTPTKNPSISTPSDINSNDENITDSTDEPETNLEPTTSKNEDNTVPPKNDEPQTPVITTKPEFVDFFYFYSKHMTFIDDKIYFSGGDGTYCVDKNGGTPKKVTNFFGIEYNSLNDTIFFRVTPNSLVDNINDYEMRYFWYNVKTNEFDRIPYNGSCYKIYDNKLVFFSAGQVYTSNLDGSNAKPITSTSNTGYYIIYNNQIYYISGYFVYDYVAQKSEAYFTLNLTDLEGKNSEKLFDIPSGEFIIVNDKIVVRDERKICIMDLKGNKIDEFETGLSNFSQLNYYNEKIYVLSGSMVYSFDFDGGNKKLISDNTCYFEIVDNKIYCYTEDKKIFRYNLDGTAKEQIV